ncbi:dipeptidase [Sphingosinicella rhizophila]|uniref:Membrane dipeptidase n=1 Tax=Sphingosinicella rhizophila TaxID=3050082 RepID=A0ABU3Q3Y8_9SPHN|nr:membrane dipeptidase [Sphingosinicella sp. GR2756]MDT9598131.1 membrane dipeptidase [Sphingosinicella sp. GR2756]
MPEINRRNILTGAAAAAAMIGFPMVNFGQYRAHAQSPKRYSKRATDLVKGSLVIDMLGLIKLGRDDPPYYSKPLSDKDAAEFRASGITAFHVASGTRDYESTLVYMAGWQGFAGRNGDVFTLVGRAEDIDEAKRDGKCAVIMGIQNSEHFRTPADVKAFYQLGQRCSQLTYNSQNRIGAGSTERVDGGVTDFGVEIIKAMNEVGMLIDVSHSGDRTTLDAIEISSKPIAFTHSNCRALVNHPRVKTDEAIRALAKKGGVMGMTGVRNFVSATEPTDVTHVVNHIDHAVKLVGIDHVGIGSDADLHGYDAMSPDQIARTKANYKDSYAFREKIDTDGFDHPLKMFDLTEELIRRNYSDANIKAILGGNFRRLLGSTWL